VNGVVLENGGIYGMLRKYYVRIVRKVMQQSLTKHLVTLVVALVIVVGVVVLLQKKIAEPKIAPTETPNETIGNTASTTENIELPLPEDSAPTAEEVIEATDRVLYNTNVLTFTVKKQGIPADRVAEWRLQFKQAAALVRADANNFNAWKVLGALHKAVGNYEGARDVWEYMGIIRPENSISFGNLGDLYMGFLVDFPKAEENLLRAIKNEPEGITYYRNLHTLYASGYDRVKKERADDVLLAGLKANPGVVDLMTLLGSYYRDEGDREKALEWFKRALAGDPGNEAVRQEIEFLEKGSGTFLD